MTVGLLTAIGFATVYIALSSKISTGSLGYAVFFFGLYLVAHVVARVTVPLADPYLLPMAALLTAIGVTEIYRLGPSNAFRQSLWIVIGVAAFAATVFWLRHDYRVLERYKYIFGVTAIFLLFLPLAPGIGETINGSRLWVHVGGAAVPAGRARQDRAHRLPRRLPAREARGARPGKAEGLGAAARDLGRRDARPARDERPRQRAPLLRDLRRDAVRRDGAALVRRRSPRAVPRRRLRGLAAERRTCATACRTGSLPGRCTRSTARSTGRWAPAELPELPAGAVALLDRPRRLRRHRTRPRDLHRRRAGAR